jgi:hypothetical protein
MSVETPQPSTLALHPAERVAEERARVRDAALTREPARRKAHGVVHTPAELARGTLAILDELMQSELGAPLGVADPSVHLIDPACGPGAFVGAALRLWAARDRPTGMRLSAIDIDGLALTHAAELAVHAPPEFALHQADVLREPILLELAASDRRVLAIAGNPPWASARADSTPQMQSLLEDFRRDDTGERLVERKLGVLSDVYVRFFRVCAEAARRSERGAALALISNGSFLDGPVHRGMRAALVRWFDRVYVLDLGGSALLHRAPGETRARDDNVFGVRPSVTISWLVRAPGGHDAREGRVFYGRLWGTRADKLETLASARLRDLPFERLSLERPLARFVPRARTDATYASWPSLAEWMPFHREGVQTNRDRLVIDADRDRLLERLRAFARGDALPELAQTYADQAHFRAEVARRNLAEALERESEPGFGVCAPMAYRPFDVRWFCPVAPLCHRPRPELTAAIEHAPEVLVSVRKDRGASLYSHFGAALVTIDNCFLSTRSSCRARAFPARTPNGDDNLAARLREQCAERAGVPVSASEFTKYALAFLAAPSFRHRFDAELHADYPRLPVPRSAAEWRDLSACGARLWSAWTEPIVPQLTAAESILSNLPVSPDLRCRDLRVDVARGCVFAGSNRWLECEPAVLGALLGHQQPLKLYLLAHRAECATVQHLAHLLGLIERLRLLIQVGQKGAEWLHIYGHVEQPEKVMLSPLGVTTPPNVPW